MIYWLANFSIVHVISEFFAIWFILSIQMEVNMAMTRNEFLIQGTSREQPPGQRAPGRAGAGMFVQIVSGAPLGGSAAVQAIREGFPAGILKAASSFFGVTDARIQNIAHVPASTASRLEKNAARIDAAATERVYRMGTVARMAIEVFENEATAIEWMRQPNHALDSTAPLDLMDTEPGAVAVRQVLNAIATGGVA